MTKSTIAIGISGALAVWAYLVANPDPFGRERHRVESSVAAKLRDPASAEFRGIFGGESATCGEVNGNNAFGGAAGFKPFVFMRGVVLFEPEAPIIATVESQISYLREVETFARLKQKCSE